MFDLLLLNGVNLRGTASSLASYVYGFALERDVSETRGLVRTQRAATALDLIRQLNSKLRGWGPWPTRRPGSSPHQFKGESKWQTYHTASMRGSF